MFGARASATISMCTKAQGYLLSLLLPIAKAESVISVDKSEFIISQGSRCNPFRAGGELPGQGKRRDKATEELELFMVKTKHGNS